jgi:hypothetical protein
VTWPVRSLVISIAANLVFWCAAWFWIVFPLMPGLEPAFKICDLFDPGIQPHVAACSGWHGTLAGSLGAILNVLLDWGLIWAARLPFRKHFQRSETV